MCNFFSFVTCPNQKPHEFFYFNREDRIKSIELDEDPRDNDSHSHICEVFQLREDKCNKYEYDLKRKKLVIDQINNEDDDSIAAEEWVRKLDFKKVELTPEEYAKAYGYKIGQELKLKPKEQLEHCQFGWNKKMDKYFNKKFVLTKTAMMRHVRTNRVFVINEPAAGHSWKFSLDMFEKPEHA
jgi:hypothetical protein